MRTYDRRSEWIQNFRDGVVYTVEQVVSYLPGGEDSPHKDDWVVLTPPEAIGGPRRVVSRWIMDQFWGEPPKPVWELDKIYRRNSSYHDIEVKALMEDGTAMIKVLDGYKSATYLIKGPGERDGYQEIPK